jgi:GT2 family glycosyltransferase/lipopolysaccharide/colanic/teichoic acid biosynthesis glycosyltransferase
MDISVLTVNYNVRDFLKNSLVSITKALEGLKGEIVVVDNASDDGSAEMVRSSFPRVKLIVNSQNAGFAKANNQALAFSKGKYIVLINPDTIVQEDTFRSLIKFFEANDDVGLIGCKILNPDGSLQLACRRSFPTPWVAFTKVTGLSTMFHNSRLFARYNLTYLNPDESYEVDAVSGSFMMIRKEVYEKIGGLDETFFMYGEDLDWCYRVQQAGWKVFYVPTTTIIHYKGESTRRSNIDEIRLFYRAMQIFVEKHYHGSFFFEWLIEAGIAIRSLLASITRLSRSFVAAAVDVAIVVATLSVATYLRNGRWLSFPSYAYPWVLSIPPLTVVLSLYSAGVYSFRKLSISRSIVAVVSAFIFIAALTAFFKQYAFSRIIVLISGVLSVGLIAGWRIAVRLSGLGEATRKTLFGRRTLVVGVDGSGQEVLKKLRNRPAEGYSVVGFIDVDRQRIGHSVLGVEILGSVDTIGKVIDDYKISEVIFSTDTISYSTMLSVIGRARNRAVNFRLVPTSLEVMIGKTSIDQLDEIPFIDIEYNISRFSNRLVKRCVDILVSVLFLISVAPFVYLRGLFFKKRDKQTHGSEFVGSLPRVLTGSMSIIGRPVSDSTVDSQSPEETAIYLGKPGLTGIIQIHNERSMTQAEREQYELYYAKNQSLMLDFEIFIKALLKWIGRSS